MTAPKLKALLAEYDIDHRELAKVLDLSPKTILRWLTEERPVPLTEGQIRLKLFEASRQAQAQCRS